MTRRRDPMGLDRGEVPRAVLVYEKCRQTQPASDIIRSSWFKVLRAIAQPAGTCPVCRDAKGGLALAC